MPSLILATFLFAFPAVADDQDQVDYNPLALEDAATATVEDLTIHDKQRDREIPIRVYLPAAESPVPVILFSHGLGGSRRGGSYLGRHWSARGYVVVAMQHAGSDENVWKNLPGREGIAAMKAAASAANAVARYEDVKSVLDQLSVWNDEPAHLLNRRCDLEHVGMSGHSFGAVTTQGVSGQFNPLIRQKFTDNRIKAATMFSPSVPGRAQPQVAFGKVSIPWLLMTGTRDTSPINDTTAEDRQRVYPALPDTIDKYQVVLFEAQHSAFSDDGVRRLAKRNPNHHRVILALSTAFWDAYLRQDAAAREWLQGGGPLARISHRRPDRRSQVIAGTAQTRL
jgi:predicted dienelactone hydrolase